MSWPHSRWGLPASIVEEMRPFPGRLQSSLQMALACVIVVVLAMSQQVPEAALSCYLIFFASRDNAASGILIAVGLVIAASAGIALAVPVLELASDEPIVRLTLMAAFTFGGMYLSVATKAGSIAATVGFVFVFALSLDDFVPFPELLARGLSWMWVVVFFPMATLVLINAFLGRHPMELARDAIAKRLAAAASLLRGEHRARSEVRRLLAENADELASPARLGVLLGYGSKTEAARLAAAIPMAHSILAASIGSGVDHALASDLDRLAEMVRKRNPPVGWMPASQTDSTLSLAEAGRRLVECLAGRGPVRKIETDAPRPAPDTFTNPEYLHFALKTMLAVFITYTLYTARGWFEIHTAMITCFYVALGTAGETLHKATLRIVGCLIGAAMGMASMIFLIPHMTDIGQLMLLVAAGSFISAWVANGSETIQYAGWQMALAFFLCILNGFSPSIDLDVATNRILGILIGNSVVAVVFLSLWPTSVADGISRHLSNTMLQLESTLNSAPAGIANAASELDRASTLARRSMFEPTWLRVRSPILSHFPPFMAMGEAALADVARLQMLRESRHYLARAPYKVRMAIRAQEVSFAKFMNSSAYAILQPVPVLHNKLGAELQDAFFSLRRLERLERQAPRRASWRRDLISVTHTYRRLLGNFEQSLRM